MSRAACVLFALLSVGLVSGSAAALPTTYRDEVLADNPAGYWRLDEASGTNAIEEIAGINGTYTGGVSLGQPGALTSDSANKAASFDGIDDSMSVASAGALSMSTAVSIEVWVKRTRTGVFQALAGKPTTGNSKLENYSLWLTPSNQVRMYVGNGSVYAQVTSPAALNTNWHHVVGTFDNATMRLYVDGGQVASMTTSVRLTPNANPFFVARSSSSSSTNFGGLLDELAVYATALPAARIQAHYNKAFADLTPPVVTLTQPPNGSFRTSSTVVFGGVAGNAAGDSATVSVKIYVGGTPTGTPAQTLTATRQGNNSYSASTSLADGQWTAQAEQSDAGGNTGQSSANTFVVDTIAPVTTIASTPVSPTNETTATFGFFSSEPAVLACRLDGGAFGSCTSPQGYSGLLEGSHTFEVRATDTAGNTGPVASFNWTIDTTAPPTPTITSAPPNPSGSTTASFSFTDGDATAGLLCQLDGGGFSPCTSPQTYEGLAFETHTFEVKARDPAGNEGSAASYTWTIDLGAPPRPTITSGPPDPSGSADASFEFTDDDSSATFECSLDDVPFTPCTSPTDYSGLADGSHTFSVRAVGVSGTSPPTSFPWTIITVPPPAPTITSTPPDPSSSTGASFGFTGSPGVSFVCRLDGGTFESCTNPKEYSGLAETSHTFEVKARDGAGNESSAAAYTWTIDTTAPAAPTITSHPADPSNSADASFGFQVGQEDSSFECGIDGGAFTACSSPQSYTSLADGSHTFRVRARDGVGNTGPETAYSWTIDTVVPSTPAITSTPPDPSSSTSASFAFTGDVGVSFSCRLDGGLFESCTSPKAYSSLAEGSHTFAVKAQDAAANESALASYTWVVDTTPPAPPVIGSAPSNPSNNSSPSFGFSGEPSATFECELDDGGFSSCTSPRGYSGLVDGSHTFRVRAIDAAGNRGAAAGYIWLIDTAPPPTPSIDSGPADPTNSTGATFTFSDTEPGVSFLCKLDGGSFTACTSPKTYTSLADGNHTFQLRARDLAGNESASAVSTWRVDTVSPTATITSTPSNPSNDTSPSFSFSANETATFQCKLDAGAFVACTSPKSYSGLAQGSHTFQVKATDVAQNTGPSASYTWTIDATPPAISLTSPAHGSSTAAERPTFSGTAGTAIGDSTSVTVKVYAGPSPTGTPVQTLPTVSGGGGAYSVGASSPLSPGTYTARAEQGDGAGNTGLSTANTFTVTDPVIIGAGDIAGCGESSGDEATADLLEAQPDALVFTLGDNVYDNGTPAEFADCYDPSWGRVKARTRPVLGDHDYADGADQNATGYFGYFQQQLAPYGPAALDPARGWYSYDVGTWHVAVVNADCGEGVGSLACSPDAQEQWLRADLAAHPTMCSLAMVHEPRWSSGAVHGNQTLVQRYWQAAYDMGAEIVLSGSEHVYERFAPQDGAGNLDTQFGVREINVGTGGESHYAFGTIQPNSQVRNNNSFGVLKLTLHPTSYDFAFIPEVGKTFTDSGSTACHGVPPQDDEAPQVRSAASNAGNSLTSITITKPAGTVQGDLLVATVSHQSGGNRTMTAPAGWTAIAGTDVFEGTNARIHGWYHVAGGSEPTSYTFTLSAGDGRDTAGGIIAISGANQSTPINASAGQSNGPNPSTSVVAPSITTTLSNTLLIFAGSGATAATYTPPGNMAERFDRTTSGTYKVSIEAATQTLAASGATGTRTAIASTSVRSVGITIAVRP